MTATDRNRLLVRLPIDRRAVGAPGGNAVLNGRCAAQRAGQPKAADNEHNQHDNGGNHLPHGPAAAVIVLSVQHRSPKSQPLLGPC